MDFVLPPSLIISSNRQPLVVSLQSLTLNLRKPSTVQGEVIPTDELQETAHEGRHGE